MMNFLIVCLIVLSQLLTVRVWATEPTITTDTLPEITVVDSPEVTTASQSVLDRETIAVLPQGDGAITDLLKILPGIQFAETSNSSLTGGEILPAEISISGGRIYDNNFMIDGLGNNSLLDPTEGSTISITNVAGHSQELFIDSSLIESIAVQRSNISARYSGFTGGVVEIETRDPEKEFSGNLGYRTTRSEWTSFHVEREDREDFSESTTAGNEPYFRKHYGNFSLDIPVGKKMGVLLAYSQVYSKIPLILLGVEENQYRKSENWFVKYRFQPNEKTDFAITGLWNPYEGEYFLTNVLHSHYTLKGGGLSFNATLKRQFEWVNLESIVGWRESENSRRAPGDYYAWSNKVAATDWGLDFNKNYSLEGGYGDIDTTQESYTIANHLTFEAFELYGLEHAVITGLTFERSVADYVRHADMNSTLWKPDSDVICSDNDPFCITGQQWAYRNVVAEQDHAAAEISSVDFYLEDRIQIKNVTFRPGLHVGYNDLLKNMDYAARSLICYDVFANGATVLSAGANRYYGKTFLTYALYEERKDRQTYSRSLLSDFTLSDWENITKPTRGERFTQLKTPYVDEWSIGLAQELLGGLLTLAYTDRNGEDEFARSRVDTDLGDFYELNNNGESRHKEVTVSWERQWQKQYVLVDVTWQDSRISNEDYDADLEDDDLNEEVCYHGNTVSVLELPRTDYNREWSANLVYSIMLPYGFSVTNIAKYRSGYEAVANTYERCPEDATLWIYDDISYPSSTTFDWKLAWACPITTTQTMTITADVTNVFNRKLYTGTEGEYEMGRQLWVGIDYEF